MRSKSGLTGTYMTTGAFSQIVAVDAICPDGKVRKIRVGTPDTMFSCPGRTRVAGINVSGNVFMQSEVSDRYPGEWLFTPVVYGRMEKRHAELVAKLAPLGIDPNKPETWPDVAMTREQRIAMYTGLYTLRPTFQSPYDSVGITEKAEDFNGRPFTLIGPAPDGDQSDDPEVDPLFLIEFADGKRITAWPEEIFKHSTIGEKFDDNDPHGLGVNHTSKRGAGHPAVRP